MTQKYVKTKIFDKYRMGRFWKLNDGSDNTHHTANKGKGKQLKLTSHS